MMRSTLHPEIKESLKKLHVDNNHYINAALVEFAQDKLSAIETLCNNFIFDDNVVRMIQLSYINFLNDNINNHELRASYVQRHPRHKLHDEKYGLKSSYASSLEIDPTSLANYIENKDSELTDVRVFVENEIAELVDNENISSSTIQALRKTKEHLTAIIMGINAEISLYSNPNKKEMVVAFSQKIKDIHADLNNNLYELGVVDKVIKQISVLLQEMQKDETSYYGQFTFFSQARKANSTLQPRINTARKLLETRMDTVKKLHESCYVVNHQDAQRSLR